MRDIKCDRCKEIYRGGLLAPLIANTLDGKTFKVCMNCLAEIILYRVRLDNPNIRFQPLDEDERPISQHP